MPEAAGLYYETHGPADAPSLILSSGLGGSASYWAPNIPALAEHFRVIAYDHRGTGRSDRALPDAGLEAMGADMLVLMDALGIERAKIAGHAIGGMAALALAHTAPGRVDRVVVVSGWDRLDPQTARCFGTRLALLRHVGVPAYLAAQPLFLFPATWLSEHDALLHDEAEHQLAQWPGDAMVEARIAAASAFDCSGWADAIDARVLLVSAADDLLVPSTCSNRLQALMGRARAAVAPMAWGGHACNVTAPETFHRLVIEFLEN